MSSSSVKIGLSSLARRRCETTRSGWATSCPPSPPAFLSEAPTPTATEAASLVRRRGSTTRIAGRRRRCRQDGNERSLGGRGKTGRRAGTGEGGGFRRILIPRPPKLELHVPGQPQHPRAFESSTVQIRLPDRNDERLGKTIAKVGFQAPGLWHLRAFCHYHRWHPWRPWQRRRGQPMEDSLLPIERGDAARHRRR